ncbi:MAG: hypothetical protein QNJ29_09995 [Rhizobiaceae bacterium]|nr:hypothetical protein [Rhizobiaceae bacterium]
MKQLFGFGKDPEEKVLVPEDTSNDFFYEEESAPEVSSHHVLEAKERENKLDLIKANASKLVSDLKDVEQLANESERAVEEVLSFLEENRLQIETEKRLKVENLKLSEDNAKLTAQLAAGEVRLEKNSAELQTMQRRIDDSRDTIQRARLTLTSLREKNQQLSEDLEKKNSENLLLTSQHAELADSLEDIKSQFENLNEEYVEQSGQYDAAIKREADLQKALSENSALLDDEKRRANTSTGELEAVKRELSSVNVGLIGLKSDHQAALQEIEFLKNSKEDDERKHDNRIFSLKAEIDSLTADRRIAHQTINDLKTELKMLKQSTRDAETSASRLKSELSKASKLQDRDRKELMTTNGKLSELNLRYNTALTDLKHVQNENRALQNRLDEYTDELNQLRRYREKYEAASSQAAELKSLVSDYQQMLENKNRLSDPHHLGSSDPSEEDEMAELEKLNPEQKTLQ